MTDLKFALVGCGRVSRRHIDAIQAADGATLAAVCDLDESRARTLAHELDVPCFTSLERMLEAVPQLDVVNILTASGYHARHAIIAAEHGKHVVVEKPMALRLEDADAMIAACERAGVHLFVVKQSRFNAPVQRLRSALEAERFGRLVMGTVRVRRCRRQEYYDEEPWRGTWDLDGGVLANQASHHIDLLLWMFGDVQSVYAKTATRLVDIETEDTAAVVLQFANGALGIIEATTAARPVDLEASLSVMGERGSVVIGGLAVDELLTWKFEGSNPERDIESARATGSGHRGLIENVIGTIRGEQTPVVDGHEGRKSLEVITAIYESVHTGREVTLARRTRQSLRLAGGRS